MTGPAVRDLIARVVAVLPAEARVKVGVEAAGHYHRPLLAPTVWPASWEVLELNPAHVTEQRRVMGRRRVKTDAIDLEAITELLLACRGVPVSPREAVLGELAAWSAHRTRRVATRAATKNQLLSGVHAATLKARGKRGGIIACALAHRANRIAFALTRDQSHYDPARWTTKEN